MALSWGVIFSVAIGQIFGEPYSYRLAVLTLGRTLSHHNKSVLYISRRALGASSDGHFLDRFRTLLPPFSLVEIQEFVNRNIVCRVSSLPPLSPS